MMQLFLLFFSFTIVNEVLGDSNNELIANNYLKELEPKYSEFCNKQTLARWNYITNITDETEKISVEAANEFSKFQASIQNELLAKFPDWSTYTNPITKREIQFLRITGPANMPVEDVAEMNKLVSAMESTYAKATVCEYKNPKRCNFSLEPEIEEVFEKSGDYDELEHYWTAWHKKMGSDITAEEYEKFINLQNEMAKANGFKDMSEFQIEKYNDGSSDWSANKFKNQMAEIWKSLEPFYKKLHAYIKLQFEKNPNYSKRIQDFGDYLPAHLFRNMWAQEWGILGKTMPLFPNASSLDVTSALIKKGYTPKKIFEVADEFFGNMGLQRMTPTFWEKSMLVKPKDRDVVCHASAEDLCLGRGSQDFRIKMCTKVTLDDLITAHHEMGHIEYFMQYTNQDITFRDGANPGFHEALGDSLALAVTTPKHLKCVLGLDVDGDIDCADGSNINKQPTNSDINFLYLMALDKIAILPFAYSVDKWRWEVYEGKLSPSEYSTRWWEIRKECQRIVPPKPRDPKYFDPAAKYHIPANVEYIRYFISHILQFQFYEAMCIAAKEFDPNNPYSKPLFQCDFSGSNDAGSKLAKMMEIGARESWPKALKILTGKENISISSMVNYFKPLFIELDKRLHEAGVEIAI